LYGVGVPLTLTLEALTAARRRIAEHVPATPSYAWPLLAQATGANLWVKHENHTPTGAFKVRGGVNFLARLLAEHGDRPTGLVSASRGNHSQSLAFAGRAFGVPVTIVVPEGNSPDKNAATEAFGAELVIHGTDFQAAREYSLQLADERGLVPVPPFHPWLVEGVATYAAELHEQVPGLDAVYVPVGMGSGVSANIAVRDLLGLDCEIVGVVAEKAPAYALSYEAGRVVTTETADTFVDGVACRVPDADAVATVVAGCSRIVRVSEEAAAAAMVLMYRATHNLAEPAGALALAGVLAERDRAAGRKVAMILTGGNCDLDVLEAAASGR
jgi:threonine dehydratase